MPRMCARIFCAWFCWRAFDERHEPPWVICAPTINHKLKKFCLFRGGSETVLYKKPDKWTAELRTGQREGYSNGLLRHRNSPTGGPIQDGRPINQIARDPVTPLCGSALFCPSFLPLQKSLCWKFRDLLQELKLLFTYFKLTYTRWRNVGFLLPWLSE